jgi:trans-aconitate methyltransferase
VLSRAVLQWVPWPDWPAVFASAARLLRPGGWLRVECGGAGNIPRAREVLDAASVAHGGPTSPWTFPDAGAALDLLESVGLDPYVDGAFVRTVAQRRPFDEASMLGWLRSQAFHAYEARMPADAHADFRASVEADLDTLRRADGTLDQTYVRLDLLARG